MHVLGLDILPDRHHFFAVIIDSETNKIIFRGIVDRFSIKKLIQEYNVEIVAIDNIFELYENINDIIQFLEKTNVTLIQVTGPIFHQESLTTLAKRYGLANEKKLNPALSAEISAKLALLNVGAKVLPFRSATLITITRSRSFGQVGGSHQQQYLRSAQAKIKTVVNNILLTLRTNNIPYDVIIRSGEGGYKSAKIICYEDIQRIREFVKEKETDWYQIRIEPIRHSKIQFISLQETPDLAISNRYLIVGVDPGETTGLALMDLKGSVIYVGSRRGIGFFDLIDKIYEYGQPIIISTDVPKIPHFVQLLSQKSGAVIFRPKVLLSVARKNEIVRNLKIKVDDSHQRDALVAAFLAYKHYERIFTKVDNIAKYVPFIDPDKIKAEVILKSIDIKTAIINQLSLFLSQQSTRKPTYSAREQQLLRELESIRQKYIDMKSRVDKLVLENTQLKKTVTSQKRELRRLEEKIQQLTKERNDFAKQQILLRDKLLADLTSENDFLKKVVKELEVQIKNLEGTIELLRRIAKSSLDEVIIKKIEKLDLKALEEWDKIFGITNRDLLLVKHVNYSPEMEKYLRRIIGIILIDPELVDDYTYTRLIGVTRVFSLSDFQSIIDPNQLIQTVPLGKLRKRVRRVLADHFNDVESLYKEFIDFLEKYRKKRMKILSQY